MKKIAATRPDEIGCDSCYEELSRFTEMLQDGQDPAAVMPLVQHHLDMCQGCGEEFQGLLKALEAVNAE
ncbi:MAG: hypothetical protein N2C13_01900 [Chloroflexota bacterium]